jgi:2-(1,2-epoxy-1,2-dihydrophenyl)acetyl-CoA isomerase
MEYKYLVIKKEDGIATLTLNRPNKLNALNSEMLDSELPAAIAKIREDDSVRVLVVTGAGRAFCSGADISILEQRSTVREGLTHLERLRPRGAFASLLYNLEKPTIAAINGVTAGGGVSISCLCDIRIASEQAKFTLAFVRLGLSPDCGTTFLLPRLVGMGKALELLYTGDAIGAEEAWRIGMVNRVVPHEQLMSVAKQLALNLAEGAPIAMSLIKRASHRGIHNTLEEQLFFETYAMNLCFSTEDFKEGITSFLEKRASVFKGR